MTPYCLRDAGGGWGGGKGEVNKNPSRVLKSELAHAKGPTFVVSEVGEKSADCYGRHKLLLEVKKLGLLMPEKNNRPFSAVLNLVCITPTTLQGTHTVCTSSNLAA
jgi:hypothetical protein